MLLFLNAINGIRNDLLNYRVTICNYLYYAVDPMKYEKPSSLFKAIVSKEFMVKQMAFGTVS